MKQPEELIFGNEDNWRKLGAAVGMGNVVTEEEARKDALLLLPNGLPTPSPFFQITTKHTIHTLIGVHWQMPIGLGALSVHEANHLQVWCLESSVRLLPSRLRADNSWPTAKDWRAILVGLRCPEGCLWQIGAYGFERGNS